MKHLTRLFHQIHSLPKLLYLKKSKKILPDPHNCILTEILWDIFKFLAYEDLNKVREVCHQWRKIIQNGKNLLPKYLIKEPVCMMNTRKLQLEHKWGNFKALFYEKVLDLRICVLREMSFNLTKTSAMVRAKTGQKLYFGPRMGRNSSP